MPKAFAAEAYNRLENRDPDALAIAALIEKARIHTNPDGSDKTCPRLVALTETIADYEGTGYDTTPKAAKTAARKLLTRWGRGDAARVSPKAKALPARTQAVYQLNSETYNLPRVTFDVEAKIKTGPTTVRTVTFIAHGEEGAKSYTIDKPRDEKGEKVPDAVSEFFAKDFAIAANKVIAERRAFFKDFDREEELFASLLHKANRFKFDKPVIWQQVGGAGDEVLAKANALAKRLGSDPAARIKTLSRMQGRKDLGEELRNVRISLSHLESKMAEARRIVERSNAQRAHEEHTERQRIASGSRS